MMVCRAGLDNSKTNYSFLIKVGNTFLYKISPCI